MIFSSSIFILVYLPIVFAVYFILNKARLVSAGKIWLVLASLFFYGYWSVAYLPLLLGSIVFNYAGGWLVSPYTKALQTARAKKWALAGAIAINLSLLAYFKYTNFLIDNFNALAGGHVGFEQIILPLGISFYTFTQIAFLVDSYRGEAKEYDFINYALFVT